MFTLFFLNFVAPEKETGYSFWVPEIQEHNQIPVDASTRAVFSRGGVFGGAERFYRVILLLTSMLLSDCETLKYIIILLT